MFKAANVGTTDRVIRILVGAFLIATPYVTGWGLEEAFAWRIVLQLAGAVLILTALLRFCPAYTLFGVRTCSRE